MYLANTKGLEYFDGGDADMPASTKLKLLQYNCDLGCLRPWRDERTGKSYYTITDPKDRTKKINIISNTAALFTRDQWKFFDDAVIAGSRQETFAWEDLAAAAGKVTLTNGLAHTILQFQKRTRTGPATIAMDPATPDVRERPTYDLDGLPLPVILKSFGFTMRELLISRNGPIPTDLDTTMALECGLAIGEYAEALTVGTAPVFSFGGYNIYGYTSHPTRIAYTTRLPTGSGWTPQDFYDDVLGMRQALQDIRYYSQKVGLTLYYATSWDKHLDQPFNPMNPEITLREMVMKIKGINKMVGLDNLSNYDTVAVPLGDPRVARAVVGVNPMIVSWDEQGGLASNYKVVSQLIPHIRTDADGYLGVVHGVAA